MNTQPDQTEDIRRNRQEAINNAIQSQDTQSERHSAQLSSDFEVLAFMAPYVVVRRRSDSRKAAWSFSTILGFISTSPSTALKRKSMQYHDHGFWGERIFSYSRAQAIADGVLVDLTDAKDDNAQLLCPQAGFKIPIAVTRAAWARTIEAAGTWKVDSTGSEMLEFKGDQSVSGRISDLLQVLLAACRGAADTDRVQFQLLVDVHGHGHHELVRLWAVCGPGDDSAPVITIILQTED